MDEKDLIITPLYLILIYLGAYWYRSRIKDTVLKKYFIPALTVKIIGAISLGVIYQFYYGFGDTFEYFEQGSIIYDTFYNSPSDGIELIIGSEDFPYSTLKYVKQIRWYYAKEYFVVRTSGILSILCFNSYSTVAVLFATISFYSIILIYKVFLDKYSSCIKKIAFALFFIPSVFFWGSGITKDTLTLIGLNCLLFSSYFILFKRKINIANILLFIISIYILKNTKIYIFLAFLPSFSIWYFLEINSKIKNKLIKIALLPILIFIGAITTYYGLNTFMEDSKYSINNISKTVNIASQYHNSISTTKGNVKRGHGGSGYGLKEFDGTISGLIELGPQAIIISLYRPFIWEIRNPMMVLSSLESSFLLFLSFWLIKKNKFRLLSKMKEPVILFCFSFSIVVALSAGLTSGNFGNLSRYRIPALPFLCIALIIISEQKDLKSFSNLTTQNNYQ